MGIYRLNSSIQNYEWGSTSAIAECLGRAPSAEPEAELWMGAHAKCPSPLVQPFDGIRDLRQLIASAPDETLGEKIAARCGRLPFLFKILAAARPLSLQAHPSSSQAKEGFEREEASQIPIDASERNYVDSHHKPEMIFALSDFYALSGFRSPSACLEMIEAYRFEQTHPSLQRLCLEFRSTPTVFGMETLFRGIFALDAQERRKAISALSAVLTEASLPPEAEKFLPWFLQLSKMYPSDPGVLASVLLHFVHLSAGDAMSLPAGNLHAYLDGLALEIMASSDNVLRGGLTKKHVDVEELCRILSFESFMPEIGKGCAQTLTRQSELRVFETEAAEFELSILSIADEVALDVHGPEIWLALEGSLHLKTDKESVQLSRGQQVFISPSQAMRLEGKGRIARAAVSRSLFA